MTSNDQIEQCDFLIGRYDNLPDQTVGEEFYNWMIVQVAAFRGIPDDQVTQADIDNILAASRELDTDNLDFAGMEKIIKRAVAGEFARAGKMLREGRNKDLSVQAFLGGTLRLAEHGNKFTPHRHKGSITDVTDHIRNLVKDNPSITNMKQLESMADRSLLGAMSSGTFGNKVREARKVLNLPKPKKTPKIKTTK